MVHDSDSLFAPAQAAAPCSHIIRVAFESGADAEFDYFVPDVLWPVQPGRRISAPFGRKNRPVIGFCTACNIPPERSYAAGAQNRRLKQILGLVDTEPLIDEPLLELARWISSYYVCPLGQVLAAMVPSAVKKAIGTKKTKYVYLAAPPERMENPRANKQKCIVEILRRQGALDPQTALPLSLLLEQAGATNAPLSALAQKGIVKITHKTEFRSLPVIPDDLILRTKKVILNEDQEKTLEYIRAKLTLRTFSVALLYGVTDSGKTEVYIRAIEACLEGQRAAVVLLPEIALTAQTVQRFSSRFDKIAVLHSGLTAAQRNVEWRRIKAGLANVVIGARSAVFAPLPNIGLVIVDEEHEPGYKQDTAPRYNGRDVAIKRAQIAGALCILGSATPSLETLFNCRAKGHFHLLRLPKRVMDLPMPEMKLVDLRQFSTGGEIRLISEPLADCLTKALARKEQAILLLNRRGYSNFIFCPSCKHTLTCRNCDVTLTFHKAKLAGTDRVGTVTGKLMNYGYAVCHYCLAQTLVPVKCPLCKSGLALIGIGSQRLEEEIARRFPQARLARVDTDAMVGKSYYKLLKDFGDGKIDILAGTQMLAKGLHFPNVTLVGIINADTSLYLPDFRANERTFQLISQVAGRAGRSQKKGTVFIQTFLPEQPAIQFAVRADFEGFIREELKHRKACDLPPYWRMACLLLRHTNFERLEAACEVVRQRIDSIVDAEGLEVRVRGPLPAAISRIQRFHRMQIIIQAPQAQILQRLFSRLRAAGPVRPAIRIAIDVDPVNLL